MSYRRETSRLDPSSGLFCGQSGFHTKTLFRVSVHRKFEAASACKIRGFWSWEGSNILSVGINGQNRTGEKYCHTRRVCDHFDTETWKACATFFYFQSHNFLKDRKKTLEPETSVVLLDFSENYSYVIQDESQGYYWYIPVPYSQQYYIHVSWICRPDCFLFLWYQMTLYIKAHLCMRLKKK